MRETLTHQLLILGSLAVLLGVANNLRPTAKIDYVRDWPPYSQLASESTDTEPKISEGDISEGDISEKSEMDLQNSVPQRVLNNQGITDINLEEAQALFKYAGELTYWIDARDEELYQKGHIQNAHHLNFYEQANLPEILREIEELAPEALVVYCKGKDCTDSHHLAQDLASEGYMNIFVYKNGFDDWYQAGLPIAGELADDETEKGQDPEEQAEISQRVVSNQGITEISLDEAYAIYQHAAELTLWIDARDDQLYQAGHIKEAQQLYFYDQPTYMAAIEEQAALTLPEALVVYCKGKDCTDSHHLAQDLMAQGYHNIFVYRDGFDEWYAAGYPIEGELAEASPTEIARKLPEPKPAGMYLEHIIRDMIPFLFGLVLMLTWKRTAQSKQWMIAASLTVGGFFIWAAWPKLVSPLHFATNIWNYDILPAELVNISALMMPSLELVCGLALVTGIYRRSGGILVSGLLLIFIVAVSYNVLRGHEFNCGCTTSTPHFPNAYVAGWNDKITLLLRDFGLLVMSWLAYKGPTRADH